MHHDRKEAQKLFVGEHDERSPDLSDLGKTADYNDVKAFYDANPARRGNDVTVGKIDDAGLRLGFHIIWLSTTSEVIARAANWLDADDPEVDPEYVFIVGSASSEQEARSAVVRSYTLDTLRDALYHFRSR